MERTNFRVLGVTLPLGVFIKHTISAYEAEVLSYVAERTTIPVPIVIDSVQLKEDQFLLIMTRLPGNDLDSTFRDMTAEQTAHVTRQLSEFLAQIRAIPPPQPGVCGLGGGPIHDNRLSFGMYPWGPFGSVYEFHDYLVERAALRLDECEHPDEVLAVIKKSHSKCHRVYFTHGDFHPGNVLVDDEYNVTGIVDWEMAAWMPEYWDYTKSLYLPYYKSKKGKWFEVMTKIYPQYSDEIAAEIEIFNWRRCYN
ncbi:kinase-like domain-containing protein [Schizophyllum amplum]|uniref:Kinase-like domain-containing protein n=1 Tax=Schizophyllum amplum TaxID=97359 RepID=A0A550CSG8_9AGAR|nr:kinase-like domain-containing protein [Auriculariopsis ampla]